MTDNDPLVYSTDPALKERCPVCKLLKNACTCAAAESVDVSTIAALLRIEKTGRNGKEVTVIDRLPKSQPFLRKLSQDLKKECGVGGTFRINRTSGMIEIQGDKREEVRKLLTEKGIDCKG